MIIAVLIVLGLALGSFVNALVWRLRENKDWVKGRSECPSCHHALAVMDLVPVLSWLSLRGRCRHCYKPISGQYPLVELLTAGLFVASYHFWPLQLASHPAQLWFFAVWLIVLTGLVAIAIYDLRWFIIPDTILYPLIVLSVVWVACAALFLDGGPLLVKDAVIGIVIGGGIFYLIYQVSQGKWIGGGDVKLGILMGVILGARDAFIALYAASLLGVIAMIGLFATKRITRKSKIPFGPFLIAGAIIARLFGASLMLWYRTHLVV